MLLLSVDMHCCQLSKIKRVVNSPLAAAAAEVSTSWRDWKTTSRGQHLPEELDRGATELKSEASVYLSLC